MGQRVKALRLSQKLTQAAVANALRKSTQRVQYIETGKANLSLETLIALANALDCGIEDLLGDAVRGGNAGVAPAAKKAGAKKGAGRK